MKYSKDKKLKTRFQTLYEVAKVCKSVHWWDGFYWKNSLRGGIISWGKCLRKNSATFEKVGSAELRKKCSRWHPN